MCNIYKAIMDDQGWSAVMEAIHTKLCVNARILERDHDMAQFVCNHADAILAWLGRDTTRR